MHSTTLVACNPLENSTALPLNDRNIRSEYPFSVQENNVGHQELSRENNVWECDNDLHQSLYIKRGKEGEEISALIEFRKMQLSSYYHSPTQVPHHWVSPLGSVYGILTFCTVWGSVHTMLEKIGNATIKETRSGKSIMISVHTKSRSRRFQFPPVWTAFSKSSVFITDWCGR